MTPLRYLTINRRPLAQARFVLLLLASLAAGCGESASESPSPPRPSAIPVKVIQVAPQSVPIAFDVVGQTEGAKQVEVRARVAGILQKRLYHEGDAVRAGAPLFQIDRAPFEVALAQASGALAQERAKLAQAKRDEARFRDLVADKAVSQKEYDDALSQKELEEASVQQATAKVDEAKLNLSYTLVSAPVAGISGRAGRSEGSLISTDAAGSLLTTINQVDPIWVRFSLAESDLAKVPGGRLPRDTAPAVQLSMPDGSPFAGKGRLNFAATEIDTRLGTQQLRAEFDNPHQDLMPGQFVRVHLTAGRRDNVFLVPQSAVMQTEKGYFVFVVDAEGKAAERSVQAGAWVGSDWTILSGLKAGDRVIIDNLLKVRPGAAVTATLQSRVDGPAQDNRAAANTPGPYGKP
ncbi:MAG TPA: efflux RND transporter periplasmic adaptor subunit [Casimicrobiaceae bacterium]|nr:efflux RND transporter periplasmic adaptor subunit [Casimicrobiaceae bacterium]